MNRSFTWIVLGAALLAWLLAMTVGDAAWPEAADPPVLYDTVLALKTAFLALLKMIIAPVIFFSLMGGIITLGDAARLRDLGAATIAYYLLTTTLAVAIGLIVVFYIHPWTDIPAGSAASLAEGAASNPNLRLIEPGSESIAGIFLGLIRQAFVNPFAAIAELNILAIVVNALLFGLAALVAVPRESPLLTAIEHMTRLIYRILGWIVLTMPIGVFAIVFDLTLRVDATLAGQMAELGAVVFAATALHGLVVLPLIAWLLAGQSPRALAAGLARPMIVAFSTSSSAATLPVSMESARESFNIRESVVSFVLPLGATMNMDGTALFEGVAAVFLAYLFGVELGTAGVIAVFTMAMLSSIGAPGMPSGSMAGMQMVLLAVGIPLEAIALLLVIERPMDTFRTAVNVEGDLIGAMTVSSVLARRERTQVTATVS